MRRAARSLALAAVLALAATAARADEIADLARQAEAQQKAGQYLQAYETLKKAMVALAAKTPLSIRRSVFVSEPPKGFGLYVPRADNVFTAVEAKLIAYVEPIGFAWQKDGDVYKSLMTVDFEIRDPAGKVLARQPDFGQFAFTSREQNSEIMTHLTLDITGAPVGDYVFHVIYNDKIANKSTSFDLPFKLK